MSKTARGSLILGLEVRPSSAATEAALALLNIEKDWPVLLAGIGARPENLDRLEAVVVQAPTSPLARYAVVRLGIETCRKHKNHYNSSDSEAHRQDCERLGVAFELPTSCPVRAEAIRCLAEATCLRPLRMHLPMVLLQPDLAPGVPRHGHRHGLPCDGSVVSPS